MPLKPATTDLGSTYEGIEFSNTITYVDETILSSGGDAGVTTTETPITITSVTSSSPDPTIKIEVKDNSVTISGKYSAAFPGKKFEYIPTDDPTKTVTATYEQVPKSIMALIKFTAPLETSIVVTYTVKTSVGDATITHTVLNLWDVGKAQMADVLARGSI